MQPNSLHEQIQATGIDKTRGQAYGKAVREVSAIASEDLQARVQAIAK
jgi:hypothetical protein